MLQPKLVIGDANDPLEHEADAVAEQVMRMPDPELFVSTAPLRISRKCAECEEEEKKKLQPKPTGGATTIGEAPPIVHEVLRSPGQPLDAATRRFMELRFGHDFSNVRVHADSLAEKSAQAVHARAYAVRSDIVFGAGGYSAHSQVGRSLLAHELTHTVQQGAASGLLQREPQAGAEDYPCPRAEKCAWEKGCHVFPSTCQAGSVRLDK